MIENEFRRIALAQGLLQTNPPQAPLAEPGPQADDIAEPACPSNSPAISDRGAQHA